VISRGVRLRSVDGDCRVSFHFLAVAAHRAFVGGISVALR
jgi:hypothetical protein